MERVTITDVANAAGVSTMTVSRVLNNRADVSPSTRAKVQAAIDRLNYRPNALARSLTTSRTLAMGLVLPDITNPFFPGVARGVEDTAAERGYALMLCNTIENPERERSTLKLLEEKRVDGVIVCSARLPDDELSELLRGFPAKVAVNRPSPAANAASVCVDDAYGATKAVHHLLKGGRKKLGMLAGPPHSFSGRERVRGYTLALEANGIEPVPTTIVTCTPDEKGGYEALGRLLDAHPDTDAVLCYNDVVAIGALQACKERGIQVPRDLALIGCDDIRAASLVSPSLTTIRIDTYQVGATAANLLLQTIQGEKELTNEIMLKPELIIRESTP